MNLSFLAQVLKAEGEISILYGPPGPPPGPVESSLQLFLTTLQENIIAIFAALFVVILGIVFILTRKKK